MRTFWSLVLTLLFGGHLAIAAPLASLLRAAGLAAVSPPSPAADFQLADLQGKTWRLHDQRGRVVFLNFWATWCPPCIHEMPTMERLYQTLRHRPFVMWAVNMQEDKASVASFMAEKGLHFPALLDAKGTVSSRYRIRGLPTTYLIDCAGNIVGQVIGPRQWHTEEVRTLIATLLQDSRCHQPGSEEPMPQGKAS